MRILFLCHRVPYPPDKGEKIRAFYQLRAMAARHDVDVFTLADDPGDFAHRTVLEKHCRELTIARVVPRWSRLRSLPYLLTRTPLTIPYFYSTKLQAAVNNALSSHRYDRIFVYCSAMAQYVPWSTVARSAGGTHSGATRIPVIMDLVDVDSDKWSQYATATRFPFSTVYRREGRNLRAYERSMSENADCVLVTTEREASLARQIAPSARVLVLPIGVDTEYFSPMRTEGEPPSVIFTGEMSYFPNQDAVMFFAREVLPLIRRDVADARFLIVGRNPSGAVQALRQIAGVEVSGAVRDVRPWLARASVAVVPLRIAAGVQSKVLEAMASGLPVVATMRAIQGLHKPVADLIDTGESAEALAARVVRLLRNSRLAESKGAQGRRQVAISYDWNSTLTRLLEVIEDPCGTHPNKAPVAGYETADGVLTA